tara:strand:+ start:5397 stop:5519 length:123 start_codon:yes stop_codon:yes gene_type:complete
MRERWNTHAWFLSMFREGKGRGEGEEREEEREREAILRLF